MTTARLAGHVPMDEVPADRAAAEADDPSVTNRLVTWPGLQC